MGWIDSLRKVAGPDKSLATPAEREEAARGVIQTSALGAAAVALAPLPVLDIVAITPLQAAMVMGVGKVYGRTLDLRESKEVLVELASVCGAGLLARQVFTTATKFLLPGLGGVLSAPYAYAVTWAIGVTAMRYFDDVDGNQERLRRVFENALAEGKRMFSKQAVEEFRRRRGSEVDSFVEEETAPAPQAAIPNAPQPAPKAKEPTGQIEPQAAPARSAPKRRRAPPRRSS
jgi:uncharacterized protein (DUF697 family)